MWNLLIESRKKRYAQRQMNTNYVVNALNQSKQSKHKEQPNEFMQNCSLVKQNNLKHPPQFQPQKQSHQISKGRSNKKSQKQLKPQSKEKSAQQKHDASSRKSAHVISTLNSVNTTHALKESKLSSQNKKESQHVSLDSIRSNAIVPITRNDKSILTATQPSKIEMKINVPMTKTAPNYHESKPVKQTNGIHKYGEESIPPKKQINDASSEQNLLSIKANKRDLDVNKTCKDIGSTGFEERMSPYSPFRDLKKPQKNSECRHNMTYRKKEYCNKIVNRSHISKLSSFSTKENSHDDNSRHSFMGKRKSELQQKVDSKTKNIVSEPKNIDVLLSKDGFFSISPGNKKFRNLIAKQLHSLSGNSGIDMHRLAENVVNKVYPGLFLMRLENGKGWQVMDFDWSIKRVQEFLVKERPNK